MKNIINADFTHLEIASPLQKIMSLQRRKMADAFLVFKQEDADGSVLNIVGPQNKLDERADSLNEKFLYRWYAEESLSGHRAWRSLPFSDAEFDWIYCDGVIERVGNFEQQYLLLMELMRISKKGVFITTCNRWHPLEFHSALPFLHWLPSSWWKRILKWSGNENLASAARLNLLDAHALQKLVKLLPGKPHNSIGHVRCMGIKAHFFLQIKKSIGHPACTSSPSQD